MILSTKYCRNQLERLAKGIRQRNLGIECIEKLQLPVVSLEFQHEILTCFEEVINLEKEAKKMFESADKLIEHGLKLDEIQLNSQSVNIKSLNESFKTTHRLDAEYFQPKFDELEQLLSDTGKAQRLGDFLVTNKRGTQPDYTEEGNGLRVLNSKHIRTNAIDTSDTRFANFSENQLIIKKFDVLINGTGVGTIGRCAVYLRDDLALPDNHVTVLRFDGIDPVFLSVQLNTIIGQLQVEKYFKGSSGQIELYPSDISNFLIWNAPKKIQDIVREQIINAEALSSKSKSLRSLIINVCELAIERTEELAIHELKKRYVNASYN